MSHDDFANPFVRWGAFALLIVTGYAALALWAFVFGY